MKSLYIPLILTLLSGCASVKPGDLLFHVSEKDNAITEVTPGMIDHVAIVVHRDSVIEAIGSGVKTTPIDSLRLQTGYYIIGRVTEANCQKSIKRARQYIGRKYDWLYLPDNDDIYCSELVQLSYINKNGRAIFQTIPMSFHDETGKITDYWKKLYKQNGMEVPEGKPGTNPGEMSRRTCIRIKGKLR